MPVEELYRPRMIFGPKAWGQKCYTCKTYYPHVPVLPAPESIQIPKFHATIDRIIEQSDNVGDQNVLQGHEASQTLNVSSKIELYEVIITETPENNEEQNEDNNEEEDQETQEDIDEFEDNEERKASNSIDENENKCASSGEFESDEVDSQDWEECDQSNLEKSTYTGTEKVAECFSIDYEEAYKIRVENRDAFSSMLKIARNRQGCAGAKFRDDPDSLETFMEHLPESPMPKQTPG